MRFPQRLLLPSVITVLLFSVGSILADLDIELVAVLEGETEGDRFGVAVVFAGDVNGDAYDDILVGPICSSQSTGKVLLYLGEESFDTELFGALHGEEEGSSFGSFVASAGDVNGDSFDDFIISAPGFNNDSGKVYLYYGGNTIDTIPDLTFFIEEEKSLFGFPVSPAGDVNGDGFDDIIISAPRQLEPFGEIYLYLGGVVMDTIPDIIFSANERFFGISTSSGDVNGDGYNDVVTLSNVFDDSLIYVFLGGEGLDAEVDVILRPPKGRYLNEVETGDLNGDGFEDIIVSNVLPENTNVFIYYGGSPMDTLLDVVISDHGDEIATGYIDTDTYADLLLGDEGAFYWAGAATVFLGGEVLDTIPDYGVIGEQLGHFGAAVASGGDLNGDGAEDFIVGEPRYPHRIETGKAFVFIGDPAPTAVEDMSSEGQVEPREFHLFQNYPNPFNQSTDIGYQIPALSRYQDGIGNIRSSVHTTLKIYNTVGQEVVTLVDEGKEAGTYIVKWDGRDSSDKELASGVYFYRLRVGNFADTRKMLLVK